MARSQKTINASKKINYTPWIILGVVVFFLLVIGGWYVSSYNKLVAADEGVDQMWNNVESAYQRRADLVPNLVATVQGAADIERDILTSVTEARASVGNAQTPAELSEAGTELNSAISRLLVVVEAYPQITSTQGFRDLQVQLEGTENRIKVERDNYNAAVRKYNVFVRRIPTNIVANMASFDTKEGFEADEGAEDAPVVTFE